MIALAFIGVSYAALLVQSSLAALSPWHGVAPDLALLVVLYLGFYGRGSAVGQFSTALFIGYLADLFAASPRGLHALTLGVVMLVARGASNRLMVANLWQLLVVTLASALGHGALVVVLTSTMYGSDAGAALLLVPLMAAATCVVAPVAFPLLRLVERRLLPDPRMRMAL